MGKGPNDRVRVTLRWIQIKDNKEAAWDDEGEFRFLARVTTAGRSHELELPEHGYWAISDHPRRSKVDKIDKVLFDGEPGDSMVVELSGYEMDQLSDHDALTPYRREYTGAPSSWAGRHQPTDEGSSDPENLTDWRVAYDIEVL
jgi:hypothetical protein